MGHPKSNSTVVIDGELDAVWSALTDEGKLTQWYAPGSPWEIPSLKPGGKITFTLMPNAYNKLTEKLPMSLTIEKVVPLREFAFYVELNQTLISFVLEKVDGGTRVTANMSGYDESLANLKALVEGKELPFI